MSVLSVGGLSVLNWCCVGNNKRSQPPWTTWVSIMCTTSASSESKHLAVVYYISAFFCISLERRIKCNTIKIAGYLTHGLRWHRMYKEVIAFLISDVHFFFLGIKQVTNPTDTRACQRYLPHFCLRTNTTSVCTLSCNFSLSWGPLKVYIFAITSMGLGCKLIQAISVFLVDFLNVVRLVRVKRIKTVTYPVPICVWVEDDHGCDNQHHKVGCRNCPRRHSCPPHNADSAVQAVVFVFVVIHFIIIRFGDGSTQFQMNVVPQKDSHVILPLLQKKKAGQLWRRIKNLRRQIR